MKNPGEKFLRSITCCLFILFWINLPVDAAQIGPLLQAELARGDQTRKIPVIVRMHNPVAVQALAIPTRQKGPLRTQARAALIHSLKTRAEQNRQPLQGVLNRHGIHRVRQLWLINGQAFEATPAQIEEIARLPEVASIHADALIEAPKVVPSMFPGPAESNISLTKAPDLWAIGYSGQGVTVAIMDTGVDINHPDLGPRWRGQDGGSNSWYDPNGEHLYVPADKSGHGTQVTGVALGGDNSGTFIGMAPGAQWIGVKIFKDDGSADLSAIHLGFQWLLDPDGLPGTDDAPDIVNNSWGFDYAPGVCNLSFEADVEALQALGIAVVFSAGNKGFTPNTSVSPANNPASFAVGSVGTPGSATEVSDFSSRGPSACDGSFFPEVAAPGFDVRTSNLTSDGVSPDSYISVSGTSLAAPHVSGAMALLRGAFPDASVALLESALTQSAVDLGELGVDNSYGYGLIDSLSAFYYLEAQVNTDFHLLAPNRGEVWTRGSTYTLRWVPSPAADNYRLAYFDADNTVHSIGAVGNVDKFDWTIPVNALAEPGKRLRVAAFSGKTRLLTDFSDQPFTILPHMFPSGGEILTEGMSYGLTWAPVSGADNYRLYYFDADNTAHPIANVGNLTGYTWSVPHTVLAESGKRFRVTAFSGATKLPTIQWSEGPFTIVSQMFPNGGEVLRIGETYPLSWAAVAGADKYRLHYFDASGAAHPLANVSNTTSFGWLVPGDVLPEAGKRFRVTAFSGTTKLADIQWSDGTFSILGP